MFLCLWCFFFLQFWDEIWEKTDFHLFYLQKKKKKKSFLVIQICGFIHLSCPFSLSLFCLSLSIQVASADDQAIKSLMGRGEEQGSRRGERGKRERETGSERLSLNISPTPTRHASQPAVCSPLSFLFYQSAEKKKKSIHISIIHTPVCLHVFGSPPLPSLSLSPGVG